MVKVNGYELPVHISHSQMTTWLSCGWKYYLTKLAGVKENSAWYLIGGSTVHEATEAYDKLLFELEGR